MMSAQHSAKQLLLEMRGAMGEALVLGEPGVLA